MPSVKNARFTPIPPHDMHRATDLMMHPLLWWEKHQVIKKLAMANPSLGLAGNSLIRYLPIMASIDVEYTLTMSSLVGHPTIALRPLTRYVPVGLGLKKKLSDGTQGQLLLSGILQAKLSPDLVQASQVSVWVLLDKFICSPAHRLSLPSTLRSVLDRETRFRSSSTTSERSTTLRSPGYHRSGLPLRIPKTPS